MTLPVWLDNLAAYSFQIVILASAGTLLAYVFRLRVPRISLVYWQILFLACLLLPALQSWNHPIQVETSEIAGVVYFEIPNEEIAANQKSSFSITPEAIVLVLIAGAFLRIIWLALGCFRLRRFLRHSKFLSAMPPIGENLSSRIGVQARFFLSNEIDTPATFGLVNPTVILPGSFLEMGEACRESIVCHELLHVRRRDWAVILIEEIIRSFYWFHPAVWWLLARIRLAREQAVDNEVVRLTGGKQPYLDSLLEIARSCGRPKAVPAPLFLKERHLVQRVALLLKEASMNRIRLAISLAGIAVLLAGTVRLASGWFPLTGTPVTVQEDTAEMQSNASKRAPIRVGNKIMGSKLIRKVDPEYPELAKRARVSGNVIVQVTANKEGNVSGAEVINGHPLLNVAAVKAVKQWQFSPTLLNGEAVPVTAVVAVVFTLKDDKAETGSQWEVPPPPSSTAEASGIVGSTDGKVPGGVAGGIVKSILSGDPSDNADKSASQKTPGKGDDQVVKSELIRRVEPAYPELARRVGVEGKVVLGITVDEEGNVPDARVASGHPFLHEAAVAAVRQWKYSPTLLNGKAVPVRATVTVVFALKNDSTKTASGSGIGPGRGAGVGPGIGSGTGGGTGGGTGSGVAVVDPNDFIQKNDGEEISTSQQAPIRVGSKVMESRLIHKVDPIYPEMARRARISGIVRLFITVNEEGFVSDAEVMSGHPFLRDAAIDAVKQWQYRPTLLNGKPVSFMATVTLVFVLKGDKAETGSGSDAPEWPPPDLRINIPGAVVAGKSGGDQSAIVEGRGTQELVIRAANKVMESKLIRKVNPEYPESAKQEGVEGRVILDVTVSERGSVSDIQVVSGNPLLNDAAIEAVKQWQYSPTTVNGEAVPVTTTVTVIFAMK